MPHALRCSVAVHCVLYVIPEAAFVGACQRTGMTQLFSAQHAKDRDDLRMLAPQLDKGTMMRRLRETTQDLLATPGLREKAEQNWYIIYGESLLS